MSVAKEVLAKRLLKQATACRALGSELYAVLLEKAAADVGVRGPTWTVMEPLAFAPAGTAIALRLLGSVHRLVLEGKAPDLGPFYPSVGGDGPPDEAWPPFRALLEERAAELSELVTRPVQTNEVGRCGGLIVGFLEVARRMGLPLRILEIGASAGLNLRWDRYRYEAGGRTWGPDDSPVVLRDFEEAPDFATIPTVVERAGCDPAPLDPTTDEGRLTLSSYVWPDQRWRWALLDGALEIAARYPLPIERSGAADWLGGMLADRVAGRATVVFHSIVVQYLDPDERERVEAIIDEAGRGATAAAPVAWLALEPPDGGGELADVHLTTWPGHDRRLVARAGYHGRPVICLL
ncbi:MAG: DUF2332 domain-containing protein [Actinomycetota bacterium]